MKNSVSITGEASGLNGVVVETGTTAITATAGYPFSHIQIMADTVFATLTDQSASGDAMTGFTVPAGMTLTGKFTDFTLTSGKVRAYLLK